MATAAEIAALYQQYLGREPDAAGLEFYLNPDFSLELIESDIANSPEAEAIQAQQYATGTPATREELQQLYQDVFGREADEAGLDFYDTSDFSVDQVREQLQKSSELEGIQARQYAQGTPATVDEINALYRNVFGRDADKEGLQFYDASDFSADQIRANLQKSPELSGLQATKYATGTPATLDQIRQAYREVLGRDADKGGLQFYDASNFSYEQILNALRGSSEAAQLASKQTTGGTPAGGTSGGGGAAPSGGGNFSGGTSGGIGVGGGLQMVGASSTGPQFNPDTLYQSQLIKNLRGASSGQPQTSSSGVTMMNNQPAASPAGPWQLQFTPPQGLSNNVQPFTPTPAPAEPAPTPSPSTGGGNGGGGSSGGGTNTGGGSAVENSANLGSGYSNSYFEANPDVAQMYEQNFQSSMSPDEYAMLHWVDYGKTEGREGWTGPNVDPGQVIFGSGNGSIYANQGA